MLKCSLAVLLAERKMKNSKVAADTGVSRTTLTALSSNQSQGIQFDTLNTLCSYLRVTPAEFFCYAPFEFRTKLEKTGDNTFTVNIDFLASNKHYGISESVYLFAEVYPDYEASEITRPIEVTIELPDDDDENFRVLRRYMKDLSPIFKRDLEQQICEELYNAYSDDGYEEGDCILNLQKELKGLL